MWSKNVGNLIKIEILHNRLSYFSMAAKIFDHVENVFKLVKIFLNQQMDYLGMKEYLPCLLFFSAKFEAMLFALCKNEDNNTASMRIFLQVCIFFFCISVMENIGGGMAAPSKSAVEPIWLGHQLE